MVCCCDDGDENGGWVGDTDYEASEASRRRHADTHAEKRNGERARAAVLLCKRDGANCQADEEGVTEVKRGHGGVLVAKLVLRPDATFAFGTMDCVDEAEAARFFADRAGNIGVGEEARRHTWPEGKDDESNEVADGHGTAASGVQTWACRRPICFTQRLIRKREIEAITGCGVVEQPDEEQDCAWDVDERVDAVRPVHEEGMLQEPMLNVELKEDVEPLLQMDESQSMLASHIDRLIYKSKSCKSTSELIYLRSVSNQTPRSWWPGGILTQ